VTAHLAAGQKHVEDRNNDYQVITENISFEQGWRIEEHELAFPLFLFLSPSISLRVFVFDTETFSKSIKK